MKHKIALVALSTSNLLAIMLCQVLLVRNVGSGISSDQIFIGLSFGMAILSILATTLGAFLIEAFSRVKSESTLVSIKYCHHFIGRYFLIGTPLIMVMYSGYFYLYVVNGNHIENGIEIWAAALLQIFSAPLSSRISVISSCLYSRGYFVSVELAALLPSILTSFFLYIQPQQSSVLLLSVILLSRPFVNYVMVELFLRSTLKRTTQQFIFIPLSLHKVISKKSKGLILSSIYYKTDVVVDRLLLSVLTPGLVTLFHLLQAVGNGWMTIFAKSISIPFAKTICALNGNAEKIENITKKTVNRICIFNAIFFSASCIVLFYEDSLISLLNTKYSMDYHALLIVGFYLFPVYAFLMVNQILSNLLFSIGKGEKTIPIGVKAYTIALFMKVFGVFAFSYHGLLLALIIHQFIVMVMFIIQSNMEYNRLVKTHD